jgi:hypothetical protein
MIAGLCYLHDIYIYIYICESAWTNHYEVGVHIIHPNPISAISLCILSLFIASQQPIKHIPVATYTLNRIRMKRMKSLSFGWPGER